MISEGGEEWHGQDGGGDWQEEAWYHHATTYYIFLIKNVLWRQRYATYILHFVLVCLLLLSFLIFLRSIKKLLVIKTSE